MTEITLLVPDIASTIVGKSPGSYSPSLQSLFCLIQSGINTWSPMDITVNEQEVTIQSNLKLGAYLESKSLSNVRGIAIAVNESVIARNKWQAHELHENDKILIIHATQGG